MITPPLLLICETCTYDSLMIIVVEHDGETTRNVSVFPLGCSGDYFGLQGSVESDAEFTMFLSSFIYSFVYLFEIFCQRRFVTLSAQTVEKLGNVLIMMCKETQCERTHRQSNIVRMSVSTYLLSTVESLNVPSEIFQQLFGSTK